MIEILKTYLEVQFSNQIFLKKEKLDICTSTRFAKSQEGWFCPLYPGTLSYMNFHLKLHNMIFFNKMYCTFYNDMEKIVLEITYS